MAEKTFREELEAMSIGDSKEYSMDNVLSIRSQCSMYGMSWNKIFQCKSDRETRIVKVTRIK